MSPNIGLAIRTLSSGYYIDTVRTKISRPWASEKIGKYQIY